MTRPDVSNAGFFAEDSSAEQSPLIGRVLAERYRIVSELGRGGMGVVYLAEDAATGGKVAVKMLTGSASRSPEMRLRFQREAETASRLSHPGICGVRDFGDFEGLPFIVMDYLRGRPLADILDKAKAEAGIPPGGGADQGESDSPTYIVKRPMMGRGGAAAPAGRDVELASSVAVDDMVRIVEKTARALHVAHEAGLVHRDIKPANVMVGPEGDPVILDFGLARDIEASGQTLTESGQIVGTPAYLAPEQIVGRRAQVDRRSDVYALGVTLYECLTLQRPFRGATWDQLFHQILNGEWTRPRQLNPHIPPDLVTVVEKAMDREQARRYQTAADLADDLKRVRSFEPIKARPPGPLLRLRRWARRKPGRAAAAAALIVLVLAGAGFFVQQRVSKMLALGGRLDQAEALLERADYDGALEAVAAAREIDPSSSRAADLKAQVEYRRDQAQREAARAADLEAATRALGDAAQMEVDYQGLRLELDALEAEHAADRTVAYDGYAPDPLRARFALRERAILQKRMDADRILQQAEESLQRSARLEAAWGGPSRETRAAFAEFFMARWREAEDARDAFRAGRLARAVVQYDDAGVHARELLGRGILDVAVHPPGAVLRLFRYEPYETVRSDDPIPRLVPVPTAGVGRVREGPWEGSFHPGDPCLVVAEVAPGTPAAEAGLAPGDLVVALNGNPCGGGIFIRGVDPAGVSGGPVPEPLERVRSLNGVAVEGAFDWINAAPPEDGAPDRLLLAGRDEAAVLDRRAVQPATPLALVERGAPVAMVLACLRNGEPVTVDVPAGQRSGIRAEPTANPLILAGGNVIPGGAGFEVDPGSYLIVARCAGCEDQRYPVVVGRGARVACEIRLMPEGSTPAGAVYIPPGPAVLGGDPAALLAGPERHVQMPGFFIARQEATTREWFEFVNDPETLARIAESGETRYLPRDSKGLIVTRREGGGYDRGAGYPQTPVFGVSWNDVRDYLAWRNRRAAAAGEPWIYDLPTRDEWERAARGADGRLFPWGDRFDHSLAVSFYRKPKHLLDAPGGFEPCDESPFGVRDMAGSREEWTADPYEGVEVAGTANYHVKGGAWGSSVVDAFRLAAGGYKNADATGGNTGFRLVLRPR